MQKYSLFGYTPNIFHCFFEVFLKTYANLLNHNDVVEHIFSTAGEKDNGSEGKDTLLYSCVRMCVREGKRKEAGRADTHRSFSHFPLSPITCNHKRPCASGFKAW